MSLACKGVITLSQTLQGALENRILYLGCCTQNWHNLQKGLWHQRGMEGFIQTRTPGLSDSSQDFDVVNK